jgi:hypothetical protein
MAVSEAIYSWDSKIIKRLIEAGIVPHDCTRFELVAEVNSAVVLRIERYASGEEYARVIDALVDNADEALAIRDIKPFSEKG